MGYLVLNDYTPIIQGTYFSQLTGSNDANRLAQENTAQTQCISYLVTRYDVSTEFASTTVFSMGAIYLGNALVQLNGSIWAIGQYFANTIVLFNGGVYLCTVTTAAAWAAISYITGAIVYWTDGNYYICILNAGSTDTPANATYWSQTTTQNPTNTNFWLSLGLLNTLWYLKYPYPVFNVENNYDIGDFIYWKGNLYACQIQTEWAGHFTRVQQRTVRTVNNSNQFPDGNGQNQWGPPTPYSIVGIYPGRTASAYNPGTSYSVGNLCTVGSQLYQSLTNSNEGNTPGGDIINWVPVSWTLGDNRNAQLVLYMVYLVVWYLSNTLAPRNVPEQWRRNYDTAIEWLKMATKGDVIVDLPVVTPPTGKRIMYGGNVKLTNDYT